MNDINEQPDPRLGWAAAWSATGNRQELITAQLQAMESHLDRLLMARREEAERDRHIGATHDRLRAFLDATASAIPAGARGVEMYPDGPDPFPLVVIVPDIGMAADAEAVRLAAHLRARGAAVALVPLVPRILHRRVGAPWGSIHTEPLSRREWLWRLATQVGQTLLGADVRAISAIAADLVARWPIDPARVAVVGLGDSGLLALLAAVRDERFRLVVARWRVAFDPLTEGAEWDTLAPGLWPRAFDPHLADELAPRIAVLMQAPYEAQPNLPTARAITWAETEFEADAAERLLAEYLRLAGPPRLEPLARRGVTGRLTRLQDERFAALEREYRRLITAASRRGPLGGRDLKKFANWQAEQRAALWEIVGHYPEPDAPLQPQTRLKHRDQEIAVYEVLLPVYEGTFLRGLLAIPEDLKPGERRAAIHCQHGWQGSPEEAHSEGIYAAFADRLARRGYVTWAPQAHYAEQGALLRLYRKGVLWGGNDFGLMIRYHQRGLDFLQTLPFVDPERIGFYGLSYGGYTALWYGALEERLKVVVCSGHFNNWARKTTDGEYRSAYMVTNDREMYNFGLLKRFDHGEFAALICPRPFMAELGDQDLVMPHAWASREYARVRRLYAALGISERTRLHWGHGGHQIYATSAFRFLARWLPARSNRT